MRLGYNNTFEAIFRYVVTFGNREKLVAINNTRGKEIIGLYSVSELLWEVQAPEMVIHLMML